MDSSIGLGFLNPTSQLRQTNVIGFCMQLGNSDDYNISERECVTGYTVLIRRSVYIYANPVNFVFVWVPVSKNMLIFTPNTTGMHRDSRVSI